MHFKDDTNYDNYADLDQYDRNTDKSFIYDQFAICRRNEIISHNYNYEM